MSLFIETGRLRQKPEKISGEEPASALEIELGGLIRPQGPLKYELTVQRVPGEPASPTQRGELIVRGKLEIDFTCCCARCGSNFDKKILISDFCRSFTLASQNELINLTPDVREDILLALPMVAVCSAECRGLCPGCGVNLNQGKCRCKRPSNVNAWSALDGLRLK